MPPCHGGGRGFESLPGRHFLAYKSISYNKKAGFLPVLVFAGSLFTELFLYILFNAIKLLGVVIFADPFRVRRVKYLQTVP
jgi:hypothetical protein